MLHKEDIKDGLIIYYNELKKYNPLTKEEEKKLLKEAKKGNIESRNKIIQRNLRFVFSMAKKMNNPNVNMEDLIAEGNFGIMKAIEKFDIKKDVKFFTYAVWWIRAYMIAYIKKETKRNFSETLIESDYDTEQKNEPTNCLTDVEDESPSFKIIDWQIDTSSDNIITNLNAINSDLIKRLLDGLSLREQEIIKGSFGINQEEMNLQELGKKLSLTKERARQIREDALNKMRSNALANCSSTLNFSKAY